MLEVVPDGSTPMQSIKALTKSVKDLSTISEMADLSKSTSELLTGETFKKSALKKTIKALRGKDASGKEKSISQTSLVHSTDDDNISVESVGSSRPRSYHESIKRRSVQESVRHLVEILLDLFLSFSFF